MRSIRSHLERQVSSQDLLLKTLDQLPNAVDGLPEVGRAAGLQLDVLRLVRRQLKENTQHGQKIVLGQNQARLQARNDRFSG